MKLKLISDGTNIGTKLIDEDTGEQVHGISQITFEADVNETLAKVSIDFFNIPVEITTKTNVDLLAHVPPDYEVEHTKSFEKEVKIVSKENNNKPITPNSVRIMDAETNQPVGAVQHIKWTATPEGASATLKKIFFDKKEWV